MDIEQVNGVAADALTLRFVGENEDGTQLHELRAVHVAEVLQGVVGIASDFSKAGAFGAGPPGEVLVRPAREGSFIIEVLRVISEHPEEAAMVGSAVGIPSLSKVIWWATRSVRATPSDVTHLDNGNVKINWSDDTVDEVPEAAWAELNRRDRRRKKHLRQILTPLSDDRVNALQVSEEEHDADDAGTGPTEYTLERLDYHLMRPEDDIEEDQNVFETEAQMSAIDFDSPERWRVKTKDVRRSATMEDAAFLQRIDRGLALHKDDIFTLSIREDITVKNGRKTRTWTILEVKGHRRRSGDDGNA